MLNTSKKIAMVARWKPVHRGHAAVLRGLVASAEEVHIGIGSANRLDADNPFTAEETAAMIRLVTPRVQLFEMPDYNDGPRWRAHLADLLGNLDAFVTANPYVASLMRERYPVIHPVEFVPPPLRVPLTGTMVRDEMLHGGRWQLLVPPEIADYLESRGLVDRYLQQYGPCPCQ